MIKRLVWLFVVLPAAIVLIAFSLANRHDVRLSLDPFSSTDPFLAIDAPFFLFLLGSFLVGLLLGGFVTWLKQSQWRRAARENLKEATMLHAENRQLDERIEAVTS